MDPDEEKKYKFKDLKPKEQQAFNKIFQPGGLERQNSLLSGKPKKRKTKGFHDPLFSSTPIQERENSVLVQNSDNNRDLHHQIIREHSTISMVKAANNPNLEMEQRRMDPIRVNVTPSPFERQPSVLSINDRTMGKRKHKEHKNANKVFPVERQNSTVTGIGGSISYREPSRNHLKPHSLRKTRSVISDVIVETPQPMKLEDWATSIYNESDRQRAVKRVGPWMNIFKKLHIPNPFKSKGNSRNSRKSYRSRKTV